MHSFQAYQLHNVNEKKIAKFLLQDKACNLCAFLKAKSNGEPKNVFDQCLRRPRFDM